MIEPLKCCKIKPSPFKFDQFQLCYCRNYSKKNNYIKHEVQCDRIKVYFKKKNVSHCRLSLTAFNRYSAACSQQKPKHSFSKLLTVYCNRACKLSLNVQQSMRSTRIPFVSTHCPSKGAALCPLQVYDSGSLLSVIVNSITPLAADAPILSQNRET